ncbi:hypothetical protein ACH5RR_008007 [Cinchona calisaya]|uniref:Auxin-responsive protein n=1 Tax=Cinchona calisaya TaxID=153742 RepID=A0ABD3ADT0_9GENT
MEGCRKLLDLIPKERQWVVKMEQETRHGGENSEEKKLELRLGPPGGRDEEESSNLSLGWKKRGFTDHHVSSFLNLQSNSTQCPPLPAVVVMPKESSQHGCSNTKGGVVDLQKTIAEKKAFSPSSAAANTAVPNSSTSTTTAQKRTAPAPVVGWPPIRSFRKNLASNSHLKSTSGSPNVEVSNKIANEKAVENCQKVLFVKINMDGVPIGRKVDLKAYDSYEKLSSAVDELFRGLLAVQGDSSSGGIQNKGEGEKVISGLLDGSGEYTLVYEDNEGDRMLVGDVPWHMFVSTVKRLRVLKSSEISKLCRGEQARKALT